MGPDEPTDEERAEELPEDNQTPFNPAATPRDPAMPADEPGQNAAQLDDTHPSTDSNIEREEVYDEGLAGAAEAEEQNTGNAVVDWRKPEEDEDDEPDNAA